MIVDGPGSVLEALRRGGPPPLRPGTTPCDRCGRLLTLAGTECTFCSELDVIDCASPPPASSPRPSARARRLAPAPVAREEGELVPVEAAPDSHRGWRAIAWDEETGPPESGAFVEARDE